MRLFLAIDIPHEDRDVLNGYQGRMTGGRLVPPDQFHITLAFLGANVAPQDAEAIDSELATTELKATVIRLEGIGHFGHDGPSSIWVGVSPAKALQPLHAKIARLAREAGVNLPRRRFVPHVTLARYGRGDATGLADLTNLLAGASPLHRPEFRPTALHLKQSHLSSSGPDYQTLASYPLH